MRRIAIGMIMRMAMSNIKVKDGRSVWFVFKFGGLLVSVFDGDGGIKRRMEPRMVSV